MGFSSKENSKKTGVYIIQVIRDHFYNIMFEFILR